MDVCVINLDPTFGLIFFSVRIFSLAAAVTLVALGVVVTRPRQRDELWQH